MRYIPAHITSTRLTSLDEYRVAGSTRFSSPVGTRAARLQRSSEVPGPRAHLNVPHWPSRFAPSPKRRLSSRSHGALHLHSIHSQIKPIHAMLPKRFLSASLILLSMASAASAQFSAQGSGGLIPASWTTGGGGSWQGTMPPLPAVSAASVSVPVTNVDSVVIHGLYHTWIGDLQMVLVDPNGVGHNLMLRPGAGANALTVGYSGEFLWGDYTFVESGGTDLPTVNSSTDLNPGTYNQSFFTGFYTWASGMNNIFNTPLSSITGPAGDWELYIYDWTSGDIGSFGSWTLNGNSLPSSSGAAYCFGDGTGANCPCSGFGATGHGCINTSGGGALLSGFGSADTSNDTMVLSVSGGPANKPGLFFQGTSQLQNPIGDGILCSNAAMRFSVNSTDASGATTQTGFGAFASSGSSLNYQYWFRDPSNSCGGGFNFSNGWQVTWQ